MTTVKTIEQSSKGRRLSGTVVSTKMNKTVVVEVQRFVKHPKYGKYIVRTKRYLAHDETGQRQMGDRVEMRETRPLSRHKSFVIVS